MSAPQSSRAGAQRDRKTRQTMIVGFLLICSLSAIMHTIMTERKAMRLERYEPVFTIQQENAREQLLTGAGSLTGEIAATSFDSFYLQVDGRVQQFLIGELEMPNIGQTLTVTYMGGRPPQALILSEPGSAPSLPEAYDLVHPEGSEATEPRQPGQTTQPEKPDPSLPETEASSRS